MKACLSLAHDQCLNARFADYILTEAEEALVEEALDHSTTGYHFNRKGKRSLQDTASPNCE